MAVYGPSMAGQKRPKKKPAPKPAAKKPQVAFKLGGGVSQFKKKPAPKAKKGATKLPVALTQKKLKTPLKNIPNKPGSAVGKGAAVGAKVAQPGGNLGKGASIGAKPPKATTPKPTSSGSSSSGGGSSSSGSSGGGGGVPALSPASTSPRGGGGGGSTGPSKFDLTIEDQARKLINDMYKPVMDQLQAQRNTQDANYIKAQADAAAFKAWRESRTAAAVNTSQQAAQQAAAQQTAAIQQMNDSLAKSADVLNARGGNTMNVPGMGYVNDIANLMRLDSANQQTFASNVAASAQDRIGQQNRVDVANQQNYEKDLSALNQAAVLKYDEALRNLNLQKAKDTQSYAAGIRSSQQDQAALDYAMGKDAANLQLKYDQLNSDNSNKSADRASREKIATQNYNLSLRRVGVAETNARTKAWTVQQTAALKKQGATSKVAADMLKQGDISRNGTLKSWEAQVKKDGKPFDQATADASLLSGVQNSYNRIMAVAGATPQMALTTLRALWGAGTINKVAGQLVR